MSSKSRYVYWDSCVFLAYINEEEDRVDVIDALWDVISDNEDDKIITSTLSIVEVSWGIQERNNYRIDLNIESAINDLWDDPSVLLVDPNQIVMLEARDLARAALPHEWILKPKDAIHLATAAWVNKSAHPIDEFHTYDGKLKKFEAMIGLLIDEPKVLQPPLPLPDDED